MAESISKLSMDESTRPLSEITVTLNAQKYTKIMNVRKIISLSTYHYLLIPLGFIV